MSKKLRNDLDSSALKVIRSFQDNHEYCILKGKDTSGNFKAHKFVRQLIGKVTSLSHLNEDQTKGAATNVILRLLRRCLLVKNKGAGNRFVYTINPEITKLDVSAITEETATTIISDYPDLLLGVPKNVPENDITDFVGIAAKIAMDLNFRAIKVIAEKIKVGESVSIDNANSEIDKALETKADPSKKKSAKRSPKKKTKVEKHVKKTTKKKPKADSTELW